MNYELNGHNAYSDTEVKLISNIDTGALDYSGGKVVKKECDLVVLGAGGSGMVTAVHAAEQGARVIVLEKASRPGGNTWMAVYCAFALNLPDYVPPKDGPGMTMTMGQAPDYSYQGVKDTAFKRCMEIEKWRRNPKVIHRSIDISDEVYRWLLGFGMKFDNVRPQSIQLSKRQSHHDQHGHNDPSNGPGYVGSYVIETMQEQAERLGVDVICRTRATELKRNEKGAAAGVIAQSGDITYDISAKAVVIATGSFGANKELCQRFFKEEFPDDGYIVRMGSGYSTGDGILMGEKIGALVGEFLTMGTCGGVHHPWKYSVHSCGGGPGVMLVNKNGERFISEDAMLSQYAYVQQPGQIAYAIFDEDGLQDIIADIDRNPFGTQEERELMRHVAEDLRLEANEGKGKVIIADTLEELAQGIGCDPAALIAQTQRYNHYCETGRDEEMLKNPAFLKRPVKKAPFYAVKRQRMQIITSGGLTPDEKMRVLDTHREPMPGFYVVGDCSSGSGALSGLGWAFTSGYICANEVVDYLKA